jgi:hypothetical protein
MRQFIAQVAAVVIITTAITLVVLLPELVK